MVRVDIAGRAKSANGTFLGMSGARTPAQERSLRAGGDAKKGERAWEGVRRGCGVIYVTKIGGGGGGGGTF